VLSGLVPPPPPSPATSKSGNSLGAGGIILLVAFISFFVYLVVGTGYNY
jgi:hypothetical protein